MLKDLLIGCAMGLAVVSAVVVVGFLILAPFMRGDKK